MTSSWWLPRVLAVALVMQLTAAAGAVSGPWALRQAAVPVPASPATAAPTSDSPADAPLPLGTAEAGGLTGAEGDGGSPRRTGQPRVLLSSPELWPGDVSVAPVGLDAEGGLEVPATERDLGWWSGGPPPGDPGAAVVVGHVNLDGRDGVFARLAQARAGTLISVRNGSRDTRYRVVRTGQYDKDRFPTDEVYRPTGATELRLITCGGEFDRASGHYRANVVVWAVLA